MVPGMFDFRFIKGIISPATGDLGSDFYCKVEAEMLIEQIRRFPAKASKEDGNYTARPIHLHLLRQEHSQAALSWNLEVQVVQEDCCWWCIHHVVSA